MDLYTKSEEYAQARELMLRDNTNRLLNVLSRLFGSVSVRGLSKRDEEDLSYVLEFHGEAVAGDVQNWYCREATKQAQASTMNLFRAVLAGSAVKERELTGKEPDEWTRRMVMGPEESEISEG